MADFNKILWLDATAQAELIRKKEISAVELIQAAIKNIEALNPKLNAIITPIFDQALEKASDPQLTGPFAGVPFLMKDIGAQFSGVRMAMGNTLLAEFIPDHDSELTARFKKAGLITLGKTNTPEFGLLPTTEPKLFGPTRNPWNLERTTGGSSGGAAASVAAGLVPVAHANDGGGSIRIPASCCGVFGLKPTRARNSMAPDFGDMISGFVCEHIVSRTVRDSAAILDLTEGPVTGDPYWAPPKKRPFLEEIATNPDPLKIAFSTETLTGTPVHPDCIKAVELSAKLCESLGHHVEEKTPQLSASMENQINDFNTAWMCSCASTIDTIRDLSGLEMKAEYFEPLTWAMYERGRLLSGSGYLRAIQSLQRTAREAAAFFEEYDILLTPVLAEPPVPLGTFEAPTNDPIKAWDRVVRFAPLTASCNATGQPAMSVPLFWNDEGLPIGSHFIGRFGDEATLFQLAAQLEKAQPWIDKRPPFTFC